MAAAVKPWGLLPGAPNIFKPNGEHALHIDVEVRASASAPPAVNIVAEIVDFDLNLIGDGPAGLMKLMFRRVGFHAGSAASPRSTSCSAASGSSDRCRSSTGYASSSRSTGSPTRPTSTSPRASVTAGFDLTLPNVSVGVFSLENIALGAERRVPFLGDAMTVGFHFCAKDAPFRLTVMCIGGGGWLVLRASPKGMVLLELGLEACACLSVDLGVASGSVSIAVGVYLRLEADNGLLTAYFRIRGEVDVLGLIGALRSRSNCRSPTTSKPASSSAGPRWWSTSRCCSSPPPWRSRSSAGSPRQGGPDDVPGHAAR